MRTVALIGDPVSQSPSPAMHRAAFAAAGLDLGYVAERVGLEELPRVFDSLRERHIGLNVTRPLKEAVVPLLDQVRGDASKMGSVNTISFTGGRAIGDSTDGAGFMAALARARRPSPGHAVILGSGGAARAVGGALRDSGADVTIAARNAERAAAVAEACGGQAISLDAAALGEVLADADLLVNATPMGEHSPLPDGVEMHGGLAVFDLVYSPRVTRLLAAARDLGCRTIEGVEMLIEQGARSFEIWTGARASLEAMRDAALASLDDRAGV
ncbi:MAG: shikimate dehydrogenase [Actinomycetota bacterium]